MARNGVVSRRRRTEGFDSSDLSKSDHAQQAHVLAVDDSLVDRIVIERLLKISCCKVTAVDSGSRALQFLGLDDEKSSVVDSLKVDLIITDYCMPGMSGYELMKKIKESSAFKEIPVVIMSSENVLSRIDRCLEEGAEDFIVKPVKLSDVKRIKNYMIREDRSSGEDRGTNSRKRPRDGCDSLSSSQSLNSPPPSLESKLFNRFYPTVLRPSPSKPPSPLFSLSPLPSSSPLPRSPSPTPSSSPCAPLDSPTRRVKLINSAHVMPS
ncbi:hypothetical protein Nepgr_017183 [Nepenthes gracilis]|uniref:Response regulatory domain-containing protein n=1 Tax=Nepenthes gracilis TaxID=150966 RepID=A0AAD3XRY1_NEPGR|nr:hypothetical protein Nepgr_017183 [Nepenthes gracilis]